MRKIILTLVLLLPLMAQAQGTLYVSNLGQAPNGSVAVASDSWVAELFRTGTDSGGYDLNSVQLLMDAALGSPNAFTVLLYSNNSNFEPGSSLGSLTGSDPAGGGNFTYTASSITLLPSTFYWIVITSTTPLASGSYYWSLADTFNYSSSNGWGIGSYDKSSDGSSWVSNRSNPLQFAVDASTIPEPSTLALAGLGLACLSFWRRRQCLTSNMTA
ncbi:MAG: choice-of-anchor R domain-containing protein [Limisphaerales bacterium]